MTAPDPRTWLDEVDARTNAATDGPWRIEFADNGEHELFIEEGSEELGCGGAQVAGWLTEPNAAWIAHARTDLPAATTALRAVLDLHRTMSAAFCQSCFAPYPCPTVTAITAALEDA